MFDDDYEDDGKLGGTVVPRALLADIGAVAVYYSQLDGQLNRTIWGLLGLKERFGEMVTQAVSSYASRVELFRVLAYQKHKRPKARDRISKIVEHLRFAGDDRNRLMHDDIYYSEHDYDSDSPRKTLESSAIATFRTHPMTRSFSEHRFDVRTMRDLQVRLHDLYFIMLDFKLKNRDWLTEPLPSLDKSPTLLLRKKNEALQKKGTQKPRPKSSSPKSRFPRKMTFRL